MKILPIPKRMTLGKGSYKINKDTILTVSCNISEIKTALSVKKKIYDTTGVEVSITRCSKAETGIFINISGDGNPQGYNVDVNENIIVINGYAQIGLFYAVQTFIQILEQYGNNIPCVRICDEPDIQVRGFYYDITRGKVPKLETLKKLADTLARYKMNQMQLYVEHTYAYKK